MEQTTYNWQLLKQNPYQHSQGAGADPTHISAYSALPEVA